MRKVSLAHCLVVLCFRGAALRTLGQEAGARLGSPHSSLLPTYISFTGFHSSFPPPLLGPGDVMSLSPRLDRKIPLWSSMGGRWHFSSRKKGARLLKEVNFTFILTLTLVEDTNQLIHPILIQHLAILRSLPNSSEFLL